MDPISMSEEEQIELFESWQKLDRNLATIVQNDPKEFPVNNEQMAEWMLGVSNLHRASPLKKRLDVVLLTSKTVDFLYRTSPGLKESRSGIKDMDPDPVSEVEEVGKMETMLAIGSSRDTGPGTQEEPVIESTPLPVRTVPANHSKVKLSMGLTKSLGAYEFVRIDVGVEDFCAPEDKQATWDEMERLVRAQVDRMVANVNATRPPQQKVVEGLELPPLEEPVANQPAPPVHHSDSKVQRRGSASVHNRRVLDSTMRVSSIEGCLDYTAAVAKIRSLDIDDDLATTLIKQLRDGDVSFFTTEQITDGSAKKEGFDLNRYQGVDVFAEDPKKPTKD